MDREYAADAPEDDEARAMLVPSVGLRKDLGFWVAAEGVETQAERDVVASAGRGGGTLVADHLAGEADQDRRQGRAPRPRYHFAAGGGRHLKSTVRRRPTADRWPTAKTTTDVNRGFGRSAFGFSRELVHLAMLW